MKPVKAVVVVVQAKSNFAFATLKPCVARLTHAASFLCLIFFQMKWPMMISIISYISDWQFSCWCTCSFCVRTAVI